MRLSPDDLVFWQWGFVVWSVPVGIISPTHASSVNSGAARMPPITQTVAVCSETHTRREAPASESIAGRAVRGSAATHPRAPVMCAASCAVLAIKRSRRASLSTPKPRSSVIGPTGLPPYADRQLAHPQRFLLSHAPCRERDDRRASSCETLHPKCQIRVACCAGDRSVAPSRVLPLAITPVDLLRNAPRLLTIYCPLATDSQ